MIEVTALFTGKLNLCFVSLTYQVMMVCLALKINEEHAWPFLSVCQGNKETILICSILNSNRL